MKTGKIQWKKEDTVIAFDVAICECGFEMEDLGSAGCNHDENQTYFYQCGNCKKLELTYTRIRAEKTEDLLEAGWKKV